MGVVLGEAFQQNRVYIQESLETVLGQNDALYTTSKAALQGILLMLPRGNQRQMEFFCKKKTYLYIFFNNALFSTYCFSGEGRWHSFILQNHSKNE